MLLRTTLLAAAVAISLTTAVDAAAITGQISLAGYADAIGSAGMGAATGIDFVQGATGTASPGIPGGLTSFGAGTGSFAGLACASVSGGCGTIQDILNFITEPATTNFLTLNTGGPAVSFDLSSITGVAQSQDPSGGSLTLTATGTINFAGYDPTAGTFILTAQGNNITSFSATTAATPAPVPEPASLALFGLSLLPFALWRRKKA